MDTTFYNKQFKVRSRNDTRPNCKVIMNIKYVIIDKSGFQVSVLCQITPVQSTVSLSLRDTSIILESFLISKKRRTHIATVT